MEKFFTVFKITFNFVHRFSPFRILKLFSFSLFSVVKKLEFNNCSAVGRFVGVTSNINERKFLNSSDKFEGILGIPK